MRGDGMSDEKAALGQQHRSRPSSSVLGPGQLSRMDERCIAEIINSVVDDLNDGRYFAYLTRWRQPEELYCRAVYVLFVVAADEIPHVISCEAPNNFSDLWKKVNSAVFGGNGTLMQPLRSLNGEEFTVINTLHQNAHGSYATMLTVISLVQLNGVDPAQMQKHVRHWMRLCDFLNYMEGMFKAGKKREHVLAGVRNISRPFSQIQKEAKEKQENLAAAPPSQP